MTQVVWEKYHTCMMQRKRVVPRKGAVAAKSLRYLALADEIAGRIASGELKPGERVAAENELARTFKVSRVTVRAALDIVEEKGLIVRRRGAGTFVALPRLHHDLAVLENLFAQFTKQGVQSTTKLLEFCWSRVDATIVGILHHAEAMKVSRLWFVGRLPFGLTYSYMHPAMRSVSHAEAERQPGYVSLEKLGYHVARADLKLRAEQAGKRIAEALQIEPQDAVLVFQRTTFSDKEEPLEHTTCYLRSDAIEFAIAVRGGLALSAAVQQPSIGAARGGLAAAAPKRRRRSKPS